MRAICVNLECITNMHVGNGDVNFNIIDNEVEKDVVTNYPTINSSGVKGALREFFDNQNIDKACVNEIFGEPNAGKLKFFCADMLAVPMRASSGNEPYYLVSTKKAIDTYVQKISLFLGKEEKIQLVKDSAQSAFVEGKKLTEKVNLCGKDIYIMSDKDFGEVSLPVVARNKLDNGKSENLWYEEIVPHKSLFSFIVIAEESDASLLELFKNTIEGKIVQFGGNASIGYGYCNVTIKE